METLSHELVKLISKHACVLGKNPLPTERKHQASRSAESFLLSNSDEDDVEMVEEVSGMFHKPMRYNTMSLTFICLHYPYTR